MKKTLSVAEFLTIILAVLVVMLAGNILIMKAFPHVFVTTGLVTIDYIVWIALITNGFNRLRTGKKF
jgi:hypothetical protein